MWCILLAMPVSYPTLEMTNAGNAIRLTATRKFVMAVNDGGGANVVVERQACRGLQIRRPMRINDTGC